MTFPRVYPVVDSAEWVGRLLPLGVRLIQLRIKTGPDAEVRFTEAEVRSEVRRARTMCSRAGAQLIVNDHWSLAMGEGCDFVHLGQGDLDGADVPALRKAGIRIDAVNGTAEDIWTHPPAWRNLPPRARDAAIPGKRGFAVRPAGLRRRP